jgi:hypothetical protein
LSSGHVDVTGHDGVHFIEKLAVPEYVDDYSPQVLRDNKRVDTLGLPALNFGVAKGATYDRVLIFPTRAMLRYLQSGDVTDLGSAERLYVAVTRARHSVGFVL